MHGEMNAYRLCPTRRPSAWRETPSAGDEQLRLQVQIGKRVDGYRSEMRCGLTVVSSLGGTSVFGAGGEYTEVAFRLVSALQAICER